MKKVICSKNAPAAIGPYVQAIEVNGTIYASGQIPLNPVTMKVEASDIEGQTHQVFKNMKAVLEEAGSSLNDVVKCTVFLRNMADFAAANKIYAEYFGEWKPARICVQAAELPLGVLVEFDAIAVKTPCKCDNTKCTC